MNFELEVLVHEVDEFLDTYAKLQAIMREAGASRVEVIQAKRSAHKALDKVLLKYNASVHNRVDKSDIAMNISRDIARIYYELTPNLEEQLWLASKSNKNN